jgi:hypothetical protein
MAITIGTTEGTDFVVVNETGAPRDLVFTKPSGVASGKDIVVIIAVDVSGTDATATWTPASDFDELFNLTEVDSQPKVAMWRKRAGGSEPADYTFSYAAATGTLLNGIGLMLVVDGADDSSFEDVAEVYADLTTASPTCPDINTATNGAAVLRITANNNGTLLVAPDNVYPAGTTGIMSRAAAANSSSPCLSVAFQTIATAGAAGTAQYTSLYSTGTGACRSPSFAIRPAAGGGASGVPRFMNIYSRRRR